MTEPNREQDGERISAPPPQRAPNGALCALHPEREAVFTCPRCGSYACAFCYHAAVSRCQACMLRDPTEAAPPLPWETQDGGAIGRFAQTLTTALHPMRSAPAMARHGVQPALAFFLLSALPFALLAGVVPHTRTLLFSGLGAIVVLGNASSGEIALDVVRAALAQLALSAVEFACLYFPYTSLVRAYAPERYHAAQRVMLYRFWVLPATSAVVFLGIALGPPPVEGQVGALSFVLVTLRLLVPVLLLLAMGSVARIAAGLSPFKALLTVFVPMTLLLVVQPLSVLALESVLPPMPAMPTPPG